MCIRDSIRGPSFLATVHHYLSLYQVQLPTTYHIHTYHRIIASIRYHTYGFFIHSIQYHAFAHYTIIVFQRSPSLFARYSSGISDSRDTVCQLSSDSSKLELRKRTRETTTLAEFPKYSAETEWMPVHKEMVLRRPYTQWSAGQWKFFYSHKWQGC